MTAKPHQCHYCGVRLANKLATRDHKIPISRGGEDVPRNLVWACEPCNSHKGSLLLEEFRAVRAVQRGVPTEEFLFSFEKKARNQRNWSRSDKGKEITARYSAKRRENSLAWYRRNKERQRNHWYQREYGITLEELDALLIAQGGVCAACGTDTPGGRRNEWHLDHNHSTKQIRGLLCATCNLALGMVGDSTHRLRQLITYLKKEDVWPIVGAAMDVGN